MKASQLYVGEYYAWSQYPSKGKFTTGGVRVRLRGTETRKGYTDINAKTYALITVVDSGRESAVPARQILDFWDNYKREIDLIEREAVEREAAIERAQIKAAMVSTMISVKIREQTGMDLIGVLEYSSYNKRISIPTENIFKWLGISDNDIEDAVDKHIGGLNDEG